MSLEEEIRELKAALKENTAAHLKLAEVAKAASGAKAEDKAEEPKKATKAKEADAGTDEGDEDETDKKAKAAADKKAKAAADKKAKAAADKKAKAAEQPEVEGAVSAEKALEVAKAYLSTDDEDKRDENKANVQAAFKHLGVTKIGGLQDDEDRAKLVAYIAFWEAGLKVDFEAVDELVAAAGGGSDGDEDDDEDMLGD